MLHGHCLIVNPGTVQRAHQRKMKTEGVGTMLSSQKLYSTIVGKRFETLELSTKSLCTQIVIEML